MLDKVQLKSPLSSGIVTVIAMSDYRRVHLFFVCWVTLFQKPAAYIIIYHCPLRLDRRKTDKS